MSTQQLVLLLAEDDDGHAMLVQRNLRRVGITNEVVHARDGQEALDCIEGKGKFAGRINGAPLLAVLDINMPRVDGIQVLQHIKHNERTATMPTIMLTTTDDPREVQRCYQLGCNVYITKPVEAEAFMEAIRRLGLFLEIVSLPPQ